jgi:hypothetical protein
MQKEPSPESLMQALGSGVSSSTPSPETPQALAAVKPPDSATPAKDLIQEREFLWKVHGYTNDYIRFGDTKAGFCFGVASALIGALFVSKSHELFTKIGPSQWTAWSYVSLAAFLSLAVSIGATIIVIRPRLWTHEKKDFVFWGAISAFGTETEFGAEFAAQTPNELNTSLAHHLYSISRVCRRKYMWVTVAILAAVLGGALAVLLLLFKP